MRMSKTHLIDEFYLTLFRIAAMFILSIVIFLIFNIFLNGIGVLSWSFISEMPSEGMTAGGIFPAIAGTALVTVVTGIVALPVGVGAAVFLTEYATDNWFTRILRLSIRNLSGVPSIVFGLFGMAFFVKILGFRPGVLTAGLTLGLLILPWTITTAEEAIRSVPKGYREAAMALGATPWHVIRTSVLPPAIPGILTGLVLGLARAAGETAPILFVGASFYLPHLPSGLFDQFMALPYHLYVLATQHHNIQLVRPIAYGTALVLLILIVLLSGGVIMARSRLRKKYQQW